MFDGVSFQYSYHPVARAEGLVNKARAVEYTDWTSAEG